MKIYIGNDNLLTLEGLLNAMTGAYINNATVTVTLLTPAGAEVTGQSWPTTLTYIAASNGNYRCTLEDGLALTDGLVYTAKITADAGSDLIAYWEIALEAEKRRS